MMPSTQLWIGVVVLCLGLIAYRGEGRRDDKLGDRSSIVVWGIAGPLWWFQYLQVQTGKWQALPALGLLTILLFPWGITRRVLIPLGAWRLAAVVARLATVRLHKDRRGGACMAAAWAMLNGRHAPAGQRWLEKALAELGALGGAGTVAMGLLSALRGELAQARLTLRSVLAMPPLAVPPIAEQLAAAWLAADAAEEGNWEQVQRLGYRARGPRLGSTRLLGAVAARLGGDRTADRTLGQDPRGPSDFSLWWRWMLSSSRGTLWPLLRRALRTPRRAPAALLPSAPTVAPASAQTPLVAALSLHARTLRRYALFLEESDLRTVAAAWEHALASPELVDWVCSREAALRMDGSAARAKLREMLVENLCVLTRRARVPLDEQKLAASASTPPLLLATARALRNALISEFEEACQDLLARVQAARALPLFDETRQWESLRAQYEQLARLCGARLRREVWDPYNEALTTQAVWLFNERGARLLGNTMFRYLLAQAIELEDPESIAVQRHNVGCGV